MKNYILLAEAIYSEQKKLLPGDSTHPGDLESRLKAGAQLLSKLENELKELTHSYETTYNFTPRESRLINTINIEFKNRFMFSI
jgi:hypothetical protein